MYDRLRRYARFALFLLPLTATLAAPAYAVNASAFLDGTVINAGAPVADADVTVTGNNLTLHAKSDAKGKFAFPPLALGGYDVTATSGALRTRAHVDLSGGGASITLDLSALSEIGHTVVSREQAVVVHGSGSDVALNQSALTQLPFDNNFSEMEIQMPGAVRGANGVVHINGDHGVINYMIDGVALPQELNRDIGGEINLNDLSFVDLVEGAYPAQYGLRFGSVFNMATRAGTGPAGFTGYAQYGSYNDVQSSLGYHSPLPGGGGFDLAITGEQSTRGLDPPNFSSPHNNCSSLGQFARFTLPAGGGNFTNVTFINSHATFQIPNDVDNGEPASTDDNETQADTFLAVQFHHVIGDTGVLTFGPAYKASRIQDFGDPANDFIYGEALNVAPPPYGNGGSSTDCGTALTDPSVVYLPTTCAYSLADTRTALDYIVQADYTQSFGKHTLGAGDQLRSRADPETLRDHASAEQLPRADRNARNPERRDDGGRRCPEPGQHLSVLHSRQLAHQRLCGKPTTACATIFSRSSRPSSRKASARSVRGLSSPDSSETGPASTPTSAASSNRSRSKT